MDSPSRNEDGCCLLVESLGSFSEVLCGCEIFQDSSHSEALL